jgi:hypothetical protein
VKHGLEKEYFSSRPQPFPHTVEHQFLIAEKHEAHTEEDIIIITLLRRFIAFYGFVKNPDVVFEPAISYKTAAMSEIVFVDVDAYYRKVLGFDQFMVVAEHHPITDTYVQDSRL